MKKNANLSLISEHGVWLVPYLPVHVPKYHEWMQSPQLLALQVEATASEPLTLAQEYEMQQKWRQDEDKCTFIILYLSGLKEMKELLEIPKVMVGDVNLFFSNKDTAEVEIMIAEEKFRRKGIGKIALSMMLLYGIDELLVQTFVVKIGMSNQPSLGLFNKVFGFTKVSESSVFQEVTLEREVDSGFKQQLEAITGRITQLHDAQQITE